jgi:hypothetical protein
MSLSLVDDAKEAIRETVRGLVNSGKRAYSHNVPFESAKRLVRDKAGSIAHNEANDAVREAIQDMTSNGELKAPDEPYEDWTLPAKT